MKESALAGLLPFYFPDWDCNDKKSLARISANVHAQPKRKLIMPGITLFQVGKLDAYRDR
jgi:hypothetical protein